VEGLFLRLTPEVIDITLLRSEKLLIIFTLPHELISGRYGLTKSFLPANINTGYLLLFFGEISMIRFAYLALLFTCLSSTFAQSPLEERTRKIEQRTAEIEKMLFPTPKGIGFPITNRNAWETLAKNPEFRNVISDAERATATAIPELPETLYKEFYRNGNRTNYENVRSQKYQRIVPLTLAECLENKGRFIAPLEELIRSICNDPSWVLPAHDNDGQIYDGKDNYIDLVSSATSAELALVDYFLQDKLSAEVRKLIRDNVQRRTFASYEETVPGHLGGTSRKNWWITGENNWNSVCHANVVCAAMILIESPKKRAWYIACAEHFMEPFFKGFTPDGYCSEGMGYWNYGFGHFVDLAEIVCQVTDSKVDFFQMPLVKNCALFGPRMEVAPNQFAAFADCSITARPSAELVGFLSKRLRLGLTEYEKAVPGAGSLKSVGVYAFPNSTANIPAAASAAPILGELRTEFADAGILICRPKLGAANQLVLVCKGGHNAEHHNHNDVGSFTVMFAGKMPVLDPGGEVYTQRTFSGRRYDSKLLNSFGHPVPVINEQLQKTGRNAEGKVLSKKFTDEQDTFLLDIAPAYQLQEVKKLTRQFDFSRTGVNQTNEVTITDTVEMEPAGTYEGALVTYEAWEESGSDKSRGLLRLLIKMDKNIVVVNVQAVSDGKPVPLEFSAVEIDEDAMAQKKPTRFGFKIAQPVSSAKMTTTISPAAVP